MSKIEYIEFDQKPEYSCIEISGDKHFSLMGIIKKAIFIMLIAVLLYFLITLL